MIKNKNANKNKDKNKDKDKNKYKKNVELTKSVLLPVLVLCISISTPRSSRALTCSTGPFHADRCSADFPDGVVL